jgi:hypothetical protein
MHSIFNELVLWLSTNCFIAFVFRSSRSYWNAQWIWSRPLSGIRIILYTLIQGLSYSASPSLLPAVQLEPLPRYYECLPYVELFVTCNTEARCRSTCTLVLARFCSLFLQTSVNQIILLEANETFGKNIPRRQFGTSFTHLKFPELFL